ncbi:hypothetical protein P9112_009715 [Eukaryota sp. TZLM1-RC]
MLSVTSPFNDASTTHRPRSNSNTRYLQHTASSKNQKDISSGELIKTNNRWMDSLRNGPLASSSSSSLPIDSPVIAAVSSIELSIEKYQHSKDCAKSIVNALHHLGTVLNARTKQHIHSSNHDYDLSQPKTRRVFNGEKSGLLNVTNDVLESHRRERIKNAILEELID